MTLHLIDLLATINKHMYVCAFCLCTCVDTHGSMCARGWLCADCVCACDCEHASANTSQMLFALVSTKYMAEEPKWSFSSIISLSTTEGTRKNGNRPCNSKGCKTCMPDTSKPPTHSEALTIKHPTRCAHLPPASQRVWSTWYSARNATNSMSAQQRMPCKSASMATDMTLETWRYRNQWLSTSIDVDTPRKTLRSWSLKNVRIMTFNSEEGGKDSGLTNSGVWHLRGWISPNVHPHNCTVTYVHC